MKVLAYTGRYQDSNAICELDEDELRLLVGRIPRVGEFVEPCARIEKANDVIDRCGEALKLAEKLHALATLIDTEIPAVAALIADREPEPPADVS